MDIILSFLSLAVMGPAAAAAGSVLIGWANKFFAFRRLWADPLVYVGAELECVKKGTSTICGPCTVTGLRVGRVEVTGDGWVMSWTGQEFEDLDPVWTTDKET